MNDDLHEADWALAINALSERGCDCGEDPGIFALADGPHHVVQNNEVGSLYVDGALVSSRCLACLRKLALEAKITRAETALQNAKQAEAAFRALLMLNRW